jgi:hypothetical protein
MNDNREEALRKIDCLISHLEDVIAPHESILDSDPDYDDPELWWASPALKRAKELRNIIERE